MEMQVRLGGVAAITDQPEDLAGANLITDLYAEGTRLQMGVKGKIAVADVQDDMVTADCFQSDRHGARFRSGNVLRDAVLDLRNDAIGDGQGVISIGIIVFVVEFVVMISLAVFAELNPVNGEALRDGGAAINGNQRAPMARSVGRAI